MMEEEIQMLFRLAMPEDWRNRMPSTPPPLSPVATESFLNRMEYSKFQKSEASVDNNKVKLRRPSGNFWSDVGLRSYTQMDFDLELSLGRSCGGKSSKKAYSSCGRAKKGKKLVVKTGEDDSDTDTAPSDSNPGLGVVDSNVTAQPKPEKVTEKDDDYDGDVEDYEDDICKVVPPNALCLINLLRLTMDCPFFDIRKQASNVLFLLKEKGISIPYSLVDGPCTFINPNECPSVDVDKYASELGLTEIDDGASSQEYLFNASTEFIDGGVDEKVAMQLELKKYGQF